MKEETISKIDDLSEQQDKVKRLRLEKQKSAQQ